MRPGLIGRLDGALQDAAELQEARARAESTDAREQRAAVQQRTTMIKASEEQRQLSHVDTEHERSWRRSPLRGSSGDYRPNRTLRGSSLTSLVMRKHGFFNETRARDELIRDRTVV